MDGHGALTSFKVASASAVIRLSSRIVRSKFASCTGSLTRPPLPVVPVVVDPSMMPSMVLF